MATLVMFTVNPGNEGAVYQHHLKFTFLRVKGDTQFRSRLVIQFSPNELQNLMMPIQQIKTNNQEAGVKPSYPVLSSSVTVKTFLSLANSTSLILLHHLVYYTH